MFSGCACPQPRRLNPHSPVGQGGEHVFVFFQETAKVFEWLLLQMVAPKSPHRLYPWAQQIVLFVRAAKKQIMRKLKIDSRDSAFVILFVISLWFAHVNSLRSVCKVRFNDSPTMCCCIGFDIVIFEILIFKFIPWESWFSKSRFLNLWCLRSCFSKLWRLSPHPTQKTYKPAPLPPRPRQSTFLYKASFSTFLYVQNELLG